MISLTIIDLSVGIPRGNAATGRTPIGQDSARAHQPNYESARRVARFRRVARRRNNRPRLEVDHLCAANPRYPTDAAGRSDAG